MTTFWLFCCIVSIILTLMISAHFQLKRSGLMVLLNVLCPFAGFAYAVYVVHVVTPQLVKQQTGQEIESPLKPYLLYCKEKLLVLAQKIYAKLKEK